MRCFVPKEDGRDEALSGDGWAKVWVDGSGSGATEWKCVPRLEFLCLIASNAFRLLVGLVMLGLVTARVAGS